MIYFVAAVAVLYNMEEHTQRHYTGNNFTCLTHYVHLVLPCLFGSYVYIEVVCFNLDNQIRKAALV